MAKKAKKTKKKKRVYKKRYELNRPMSMIVHTKKLSDNLDKEVETNPATNYIEVMNTRLNRDYEQHPIQPGK